MEGTETEDIFLSILIAAYHSGSYIKTCIDSIVKADCPGLEIVVVLGESADQTNSICRQYERAGMLTCIMQDGKGLSNARNCGIRRARGTYLTFVDADDCLETKRFAACIRYLKQALQEQTYDAVINDFLFVDGKGKLLLVNRQIPLTGHAAELYHDFTLRLVQSRGTFWNAWRYLYRTDYIKACGRHFQENRSCEDLEFAVRTLLDTDRIACLHMPYYCYCPIRPYSLMNSKDMEMIKDFLWMEKRLFAFCRQDGSVLAGAVAEKLKELLVLNLPDIQEIDRKEQGKVVRRYNGLIREIELPENRSLRMIFCLCRMGFTIPVSRILCLLKRLRRKWRYHK